MIVTSYILGVFLIVGSLFKGFCRIAKKTGQLFVVISGSAFTFSHLSDKAKDTITKTILVIIGAIFIFLGVISALF